MATIALKVIGFLFAIAFMALLIFIAVDTKPLKDIPRIPMPPKRNKGD